MCWYIEQYKLQKNQEVPYMFGRQGLVTRKLYNLAYWHYVQCGLLNLDLLWSSKVHRVSLAQPSLTSHPYFSSWCACTGKEGKNTSGKMCQVFVPSAGLLAGPIKFEHSK